MVLFKHQFLLTIHTKGCKRGGRTPKLSKRFRSTRQVFAKRKNLKKLEDAQNVVSFATIKEVVVVGHWMKIETY